jgi:SAM-dependent methyltransferase
MLRTEKTYVSRIRQKYNAIDEIWEASDRWHLWTKAQIERALTFVRRTIDECDLSPYIILDVGSAGHSYFPSTCFRVDVDIAENSLRSCEHPVCANAEALPLCSAVADLAICVGPVINYCSLEEVVSELARTTKENGTLVLHVELSNSWEHFGTKAYRADVAFVTSFYRGDESYWVYSDDYVRRILRSYGFRVTRTRYFHILSSLAYRLIGRPNLCSYLAISDRILGGVSFFGSIGDSAIYFACREEP